LAGSEMCRWTFCLSITVRSVIVLPVVRRSRKMNCNDMRARMKHEFVRLNLIGWQWIVQTDCLPLHMQIRSAILLPVVRHALKMN
jgi:hypothetical protein